MVILNISRQMIAPTLKPISKPCTSPHFHIENALYIKYRHEQRPALENEVTVQKIRERIYPILNYKHLKIQNISIQNITYILSKRMEHKIETKIIGWKQYQIQYEKVNDNEVNLTVCNSQSRFKYASKNVGFKYINLKGFQAAVNGTNKDFALELKEVEDKAEKVEKAEQGQREGQNSGKYLEFVVTFSSFILKKIEEVIRIPFHSKISAITFYKTNLARLSQRIAQIQAKNENSLQLVAGTLQSKQFKSNIDPNYGDPEGSSMDYQLIKLLDIHLPEYSKYQIQMSMFLNCKQTYFYLYSDINYKSPLPNGAMLVPVCNQFIPIKITFMIDNETMKQNLHTFYAYDIVDYPFLVQNLIVTALKVPK